MLQLSSAGAELVALDRSRSSGTAYALIDAKVTLGKPKGSEVDAE